MGENIVGRGNNIKCYDKVKFRNLATGQILHACNFQWSSGSYNQAVSCHKVPDQSDWFVPVKPSQPQSSYYFKYNDSIHICHSHTNKYLQLSTQYQSQVSKKMEVSLRGFSTKEEMQEWTIELMEDGNDQFWRVGELIMIKKKDSYLYLCGQKKKLKQNDQYQVFGQQFKQKQPKFKQTQIKQNTENNKTDKKGGQQFLWRVCETIPFIYTPPLTDKKKVKQNVEEEELKRLTKMRNSMPKKSAQKKVNENAQIIKIQNRRLEQVSIEACKLEEQQNNKPGLLKTICCCLCRDSEEYSKID